MGLDRRDFLRTGLAAACGASMQEFAPQLGRSFAATPHSAGWSQVPGILASIVPPKFAARDFVITSYGATSANDCRPALAAAILACHNAGGGRVVVPAGAWLSNGPIHLLSNVNLFLDDGAHLTFGANPRYYLPLQLVRWQGIRCYNYSPLIYAYQQKNIAVTGSGTFYGLGASVWARWTDIEGTDWDALQTMASNGVPVTKRLFGTDHYLRPTMFEPYDCENVLVQGVTFSDSPFWTMHPTFCTNVTIQEVTVTPGAENDDGCDPDSCLNVFIGGCNFSTVDDNISIKAGTNPDALGLPGCQNIVIQNCNCLRSAWSGITIGSQIGGTVSNVFVENCTVNNSLNAHYIKGNGNLGGGVENVYIRSNQVYTCRTVFCLSPDAYTVPGSQGPPIFSNYNMQGVSCVESLDEPFLFTGDARRPISDVNLSDIAIQATNSKKAGVITNTTDLSAVGITIKGVPVTVSG